MAPKKDRLAAVEAAAKAWEGAPLHIKAMAGAYVGPLLKALQAISAEMDGLSGVNSGCGLKSTQERAGHGCQREREGVCHG